MVITSTKSHLGLLGHFTENPWNIVDCLGKFSMITFFIVHLSTSDGMDAEVHDDHGIETLESYLIVIGTIAQFLRAINSLKIIDSFRSLIKLLTETLFDMIPFLTLLLAMIFMIGMIDNIVHKH